MQGESSMLSSVLCLFSMDNFSSCLQSVFDDLESGEMMKARTRSNPYELIKGAFFQNR